MSHVAEVLIDRCFDCSSGCPGEIFAFDLNLSAGSFSYLKYSPLNCGNYSSSNSFSATFTARRAGTDQDRRALWL